MEVIIIEDKIKLILDLYVDIPLNNDALKTTTTLPPQILPTDKNSKSFSEECKKIITNSKPYNIEKQLNL